MSEADIMSELQAKNITVGIKQDEIQMTNGPGGVGGSCQN